MGKNIGKNISRNLSGKYSQKRLDHAKHQQQMLLKLPQKEQFKKQQSQKVIWLVVKCWWNYKNLKNSATE